MSVKSLKLRLNPITFEPVYEIVIQLNQQQICDIDSIADESTLAKIKSRSINSINRYSHPKEKYDFL